MARFLRIVTIGALSLVLMNCPSAPKPPENTVAAPAYSPAEGTYAKTQTVAITSSTDGAEIHYTTDGSVPTPTSGTVYASPIPVAATTTIRALATKTGWTDSPVTSATFTITGQVATVQFSPVEGTFDTSATVTLSTPTDGAQIYFSTDGTDPTVGNGTLYAGPISVTTTQTIKAIAVKQGWDNATVASATFTINVAQTVTTPAVTPISDVEIDDARNALARAKEVDADFFDPDNYDKARSLLDDGTGLRMSDPATARQKLVDSKTAADLAFTNSVQRAAADMGASLEAARQRLLAIQADKFLPADYQSSTAGIDEATNLFNADDYAGARARGYQALKDMTDLKNRLETQLASVRTLKYDTEQLMKQAESGDAYTWAPDQRDKVDSLYLKGIDSYNGYKLDDAEENFGAAKQAAMDTMRIAKEAQDTSQASEKAKAEALQQQVMKSLMDASTLTIVTEDGTVIKPQNWTDEDFLKEIDQLMQQDQSTSQGGTSMALPTDESVVVMADDVSVNLLQQARDLWTQGLKEKAAGNYGKAQDLFSEAQRYVDIYKSYAVKGVYVVRLIPENRDCLWRIAAYADIYGDPYKWPTIWRRNRKLIQNPDLIYPGWQLVIPPQ